MLTKSELVANAFLPTEVINRMSNEGREKVIHLEGLLRKNHEEQVFLDIILNDHGFLEDEVEIYFTGSLGKDFLNLKFGDED